MVLSFHHDSGSPRQCSHARRYQSGSCRIEIKELRGIHVMHVMLNAQAVATRFRYVPHISTKPMAISAPHESIITSFTDAVREGTND